MDCCCANWIGDLARTHAGTLAAIVRREGVQGADVLDVVQDAFYTLLLIAEHDAKALRDRPDEAARLLATIARNAARNARRKHHRSKVHEPLDSLTAETPSPEVAIDRAGETAQLAGCMRELGDLHRHVVTLRVLEELSGAETAERLGVSPGYIAVLLHRARAELASCMTRT
jgi:RNA polymerase sigma-70 factor (ECF subfamily)